MHSRDLNVAFAGGKWVRVSEADQQSVATHVCDHVLPFLEDMQILCDQAEVIFHPYGHALESSR